MTLLHPASLSTSVQVRHACRSGQFRAPTSGCAPTEVQANLIVVPARYANDFRGLCVRNPVCCPLVGENVAPGDWRFAGSIAQDGDVRKDAPGYNIFEQALVAASLPPRHQISGRNVPMYKTNIPLCPSGVFKGCMVVSMRPYRPEDIERVRDISRPYIRTHGEPIAWGPKAAAEIGIADVLKPDFGDVPVIEQGEVPVFWGCGVSPQLALMSSPEVDGVCIGHAPGKMICLDIKIEDMLRT